MVRSRKKYSVEVLKNNLITFRKNGGVSIMKDLVLVILVGLLAVSTANAFYDNFEGHTGVGSFLVASDYDPDGTLASGSWSIVEDSVERVQIHESPVTPMAPYSDAINTVYGDKFMHVMRGNSGSCRAWAQLDSADQSSISSSGSLIVNFKVFNLVNGTDSGDAISITGFDSVAENFGNRAFDLVFRNNGTIWVYDGSGNPTAGSYNVNAWNDVEIIADFTTDTYSLSVNGSPVASGLGWAGGDLSKIQTVALSAFSFDSGLLSRGGFDNLSIVPEPATLSLLAIGAFSFVLRRKK